MKFLLALLPLFTILFSGCKPQQVDPYQEFSYMNETREYIYYAPPRLKPNSPLVFAVHGYTDNALNFMNYTKMNSWADSLGFAVCYPQGSIDNKGNTYWYVGYSFHQNNDIKNDIGFIEALAVFLQSKHKHDPARTYITGMSNGGDLCVTLACKPSQIFKAYAPVVGCLMAATHATSKYQQSPMLFMNGTADSTTFYAGDILNKQNYGPYWGTEYMVQYFVTKNAGVQVATDTLRTRMKADKTMAVRYRYTNGHDNTNPITSYKIVGGGHDWTGSSGSKCIDASREIVNFFMSLH